MSEHNKIETGFSDPGVAFVDEKIAPLIVAMHNAGISIVTSCQENKPGIIWIWLSEIDDLKRFVDIIVNGIGSHVEENDYLLDRITSGSNDSGHWEYSIGGFFDPREYEVDDDTVDTNFTMKSDIQITPSVRFPVKDYDAVLKVFKMGMNGENKGEKESMPNVLFEGFESLKCVACGAETVEEVADMLEAQAATIREMVKDGVQVDLDDIGSGHLSYTTEDPKIAEKYGLVNIEDDEQGHVEIRNAEGELVGEKKDTKGNLSAAEQFVLEESEIEIDKPCYTLGYCPYGGMVEDFPIHEIAVKYAEEHDMFVKDSPNGFVKCERNDPDAIPDLNTILKQKLVEEPHSCEVFGHDCPVFSVTEPFVDVKEN